MDLTNITKEDIEKALEKLYYNPELKYKSDNTGEEYSILYKDRRFSIQRIHEQLCLNKIGQYEREGSSDIYDFFIKFYEILPRIGYPNESGSKDKILKNLKDEFADYLIEKGLIKDNTNKIDPFYLINKADTPAKKICKEREIYFLKIFENEDTLEKYYNALSEALDKSAVDTYRYKTNKLKAFFDEKYDGFINWIKWKGSYPSGKQTQYYVVSQREYYEEHKRKGILAATTKEEHRRMRELKNGDVVISFHNGNIEDVITITGEPVIDENNQSIVVNAQYETLTSPISRNEIRAKIPEKIFYRLTQYGYPFEKPQSSNDCSIKQRGYLFYFKKEVYDILMKGKSYSIQNDIGDISIMLHKKPEKENKNLILYGPPGTGKTFNTIVEAIKILDKALYDEYKAESKTYNDLETKFNNFKEQRRIEFVTFHQSYSYEEFVEGIKPYIPQYIWRKNKEEIEELYIKSELPDVRYIGQLGVFKRICNVCNDIRNLNFEKAWEDFKINHPAPYKLKTASERTLFEITEYRDDSIKIDKIGNLIPVDEIKNIYEKDKTYKFDKQQDIREFIKDGRYASYCFSILQELKEKPCILIIDEINRGNISKIFGELITLIEEDKRDKLKVRLPYSQEEFTVPENLYIIGTMNTSDRSIASVDIALRRRFKFKEMMPKPELVADFECEFDDKFKTLNKKISILLDRDHQIGHSYFIKDKYKNADIDVLQNIWFDSIMPLLNEYFYGDWEKLQEILGAAENEKGHNENSKYSSFIKKLDHDCIKTSCYDATTDCFDFVREDEVDFDAALNRAFSKKAQEQK